MANNIHFIKEDHRWIRQMFVTDPDSYDEFIRSRRTSTSNFYKYEDTSLGGHRTMNPPPQANRYCDPKGMRTFDNVGSTQISYGMGDYYSEALDDNMRTISFRCGVPEYTGLISFFSNFYNSDAALVAKSGQNSEFFYTAGKLSGYVAILPFVPFIVAARLFRAVIGAPSTRFYYLRPTMPIYWNAVQGLANRIAANIGLTIPQQNTELAKVKRDSNGVPIRENGELQYESINFDIPAEQFNQYTKLVPDLWRTSGGIDVYALSTRAQRLADLWNSYFTDLTTDPNITDDETWRQGLSRIGGATHAEMVNRINGTPLQEALKRWYDTGQGGKPTVSDSTGATVNAGNAALATDPKHTEFITDAGNIDRFEKYLRAEARDGAQFVTFHIPETQTASESMSNSTKPIELGEKFNSLSSGYRSARINFADGNTGNVVLDGIVSSVRNFFAGAVDGVQMSGLLALAGNALVDIPKMWDSSSTSLPAMTYNIQLRSPYGNKLSRFQNILLPLSMILAAGLPRSTGSQSYSGPFLIELYDKGHAQTRLGMIESISITRGVGNIGWSQDDEFLGVDVSITVVDMSSIMHMPLGTTAGPTDVLRPGGTNRAFFGDDTPYTDYISVLSSLGLAEQIYRTRAFARNWRRMKLDFDSYFSLSHAASWWTGTVPGRVISALSNVRASAN